MREVVRGARACPLCECLEGRPVWSEDGLRYLRCSACGVMWSDITASAYAALRHNVWDDEAVDEQTEDFYGRARERAHEAFLGRLAPGPGRLLDVGCGLGYFLARAQATWDVRGCDTSHAWVQATNERLGGAFAAHGEPEVALAPDEAFDLITVWDVIEHIHDPVPFLRTLAARLRPGGRIFLRTPNIAYVLPLYTLRRRLGEDVQLGPTNHVVYFRARTMRLALSRASLVPIAWPVLPPPQVETFGRPGNVGPVVALKNGYARAAERAGRLTRGRVVLGADLDVLAARPAG